MHYNDLKNKIRKVRTKAKNLCIQEKFVHSSDYILVDAENTEIPLRFNMHMHEILKLSKEKRARYLKAYCNNYGFEHWKLGEDNKLYILINGVECYIPPGRVYMDCKEYLEREYNKVVLLYLCGNYLWQAKENYTKATKSYAVLEAVNRIVSMHIMVSMMFNDRKANKYIFYSPFSSTRTKVLALLSDIRSDGGLWKVFMNKDFKHLMPTLKHVAIQAVINREYTVKCDVFGAYLTNDNHSTAEERMIKCDQIVSYRRHLLQEVKFLLMQKR